MITHELKIDHHWAIRLLSGTKKAEIRRNDRDFQQGDLIRFTCNGQTEPLTCHCISGKRFRITHVLTGVDGLSGSWCVLSLARSSAS